MNGIQILIFCLLKIAQGIQISIFLLVKFSEVGSAILILSLHQPESLIGAVGSLLATGKFRLSVYSVVVSLLNFLIKSLSRVGKLQVLDYSVHLRCPYIVSGVKPVENGYAKVQAYILVEIVVNLLAKTLRLKS